MMRKKAVTTKVAAMIDKRPMPDQQWQISITFTDDAPYWKAELDKYIKEVPEEQKKTMHLEARIISFLMMHDFSPLSRDFFVKK